MEWLAGRTGVAAPQEELTYEAAHAWLSEHWERALMQKEEVGERE
jgi:hypothetical protein